MAVPTDSIPIDHHIKVSRRWLVGATTLAALLLSVAVFSPRLWLFHARIRETFQWDRAHDYLLQCEQPFRHDVAPPVLWRLLPPIVSHILGLRGDGGLLLPWLGVIAATAYVAHLCSRRSAEPRIVFGGTLLFCTTSAVWTPVGWLGVNDAWVWLGLLAVSFSDSSTARIAAYFLCPWVDERFLFGLPLAWVVRGIDRNQSSPWQELRVATALIPYLALRLAFAFAPGFSQPSKDYLLGQIFCMPGNIMRGPMGWWMGLRAAWLPTGIAMRLSPLPVMTSAFAGLATCTFLAADSSRNIAFFIPLVLLGIFHASAHWPKQAPRAILLLAIANLLIPTAHVSYTKIDPIDNLLVELFRILRSG